MDYCALVLRNNLTVTKEFNETIFNRMEDESNFIITTLENYQVLFEEAQVATNNASNQTTGVFAKLAEFFKRIFGIFSEKTKSMFESNKAWMDANFNKFDKIDYSKLKIQMIPFWNMPINRLKTDLYTIQKQTDKIMSNKQTLEKYKNLDEIKKDIYSEYLDANDDLTNGLKNYYRGGNAKGVEAIALEGDKLKTQVIEFKNYCFNYGKDIEPMVKALMDASEKEFQRVEKVLKTRPVSENFCLVENTFYSSTDIAQLDSFILLEADQPKQPEKTTDEPKKLADTTKKTNHTEVTIVNKSDAEQKKTDEVNQKYDGLSTIELIFLKNNMQIKQLVISALMTVLEERFKAYMNALKAIIKEAGSTVDNDPDEKGTKKAMGTK